MRFHAKTITSPVGRLKLIAGDAGLTGLIWENDDPRRVRLGPLVEASSHPILIETERQLTEYFNKQRTRFVLPLHFMGTEFQKLVWQALLRIPFGQIRSYGQIARELGRPNATRAVGAANGRNPIAIVAPCHRVIGASGALTGFAGGLAAKAKLLAIEGRDFGSNAPARSRDLAAPTPRREATAAIPGLFND